MMLNSRSFFVFALVCGMVSLPASRLLAQRAAASSTPQAQSPDNQDEGPDPLKRQRSDKERYQSQKALRQELKGTYKTWLNRTSPTSLPTKSAKPS